MNVLLGMSARALSVFFTNEIGNVIPTFSVLSSGVVRFIRVLYIVPYRYKYLVPRYAFFVYGDAVRKKNRKWWYEIRQERGRDIETERNACDG
jgi:hypothetical protein